MHCRCLSAWQLLLLVLVLLGVPTGALFVADSSVPVQEHGDIGPYPTYTGLVGRLTPVFVDEAFADTAGHRICEALAVGRPFDAADVVLSKVAKADLWFRQGNWPLELRLKQSRKVLGTHYNVTALVGSTTIEATLLVDSGDRYMVTSFVTSQKQEQEEDEKDKEGSQAFRVMTYNIWNYNGDWKRRLRLIGRDLCSVANDAVVVQEVRYGRWRSEALATNGWNWTLGRSQAEHIARECARRGVQMEYVWQPAMTYLKRMRSSPEYDIEGVAVFTRHHIAQHRTRFLTRDQSNREDAHQRVALAALVVGPRGLPPLAVVSTHWSLSAAMAEHNAEEAAELAEQVRADWGAAGVVLAGDFNVLPASTPLETLRRAGLRDAWDDTRASGDDVGGSSSNNNKDGLTWAKVPGNKNIKRCDFVFYHAAEQHEMVPFAFEVPGVAPCSSSSGTRVCASDHVPLAVSFLVTNSTATTPIQQQQQQLEEKEEL